MAYFNCHAQDHNATSRSNWLQQGGLPMLGASLLRFARTFDDLEYAGLSGDMIPAAFGRAIAQVVNAAASLPP
jgi:hypothetical protein